jgi:hypothetical protein
VQGTIKTGTSGMPRYRAGDLEIAVDIDPATAQVGDNKIMIEVRDAEGQPVQDIDVDAYAQMPAMGAMPAMRAPADLEKVSPGRYEGSMDLSMRGEWPLTIEIKDSQRGDKRLQFDLATDREGLAIATGATPVGAAAMPADDANVITIDNRRRQLIGVETGEATHRNLVKAIRAVGVVKLDERLLSQVTLKFDGYIGDLKANYVGTEPGIAGRTTRLSRYAEAPPKCKRWQWPVTRIAPTPGLMGHVCPRHQGARAARHATRLRGHPCTPQRHADRTQCRRWQCCQEGADTPHHCRLVARVDRSGRV